MSGNEAPMNEDTPAEDQNPSHQGQADQAKLCPFCKSEVVIGVHCVGNDTQFFLHPENQCILSGFEFANIGAWNTRTEDDALRQQIADLEGKNTWLMGQCSNLQKSLREAATAEIEAVESMRRAMIDRFKELARVSVFGSVLRAIAIEIEAVVLPEKELK